MTDRAASSGHRTDENPFRDDLPPRRAGGPCTIVLFGATGDLTRRKLAPALYSLAREGHLPPKVTIVGVARRDKSDDEFREEMAAGIREHARAWTGDDPLLQRLLSSTVYHRASFDDPEGYRTLRARLEEIEARDRSEAGRLFYLATAPEYFLPVVERLGESGLVTRSVTPASVSSPWTRVVVEKPIGHDLESAIELNDGLSRVLDESQIYRIDHYLGKETVQNILALRFANGIFEPLWNHKYVSAVQITVAESLGVGHRGPYYDSAGALRDMVQNHMLQLLALVGMEPPISLEADAVRDEKVKVLRSLRRIEGPEVARHTLRAQYATGSLLGEPVAGYREEERVPSDSSTATYAALRAYIDSWRWAGVPFCLRHGKRLPKRVTEIAIQFSSPPRRLFGSSDGGSCPNSLVLEIQPDEGISLAFGSKVPGPNQRIRQVRMDFRYGSSFGESTPEAYERLLLDAIQGDSTLFTRRDEVEASWRFIDPILREWERDGAVGLHSYAAGTWGPEAADALADAPCRGWRRP